MMQTESPPCSGSFYPDFWTIRDQEAESLQANAAAAEQLEQ